MNNQYIHILIGISGSGKTTWSRNLIKKDPNTVRVNRDDIRMQITASKDRLLDSKLEKLVTKIQHEQIKTMLDSGYNVIIDNTNLKGSYIKGFIDAFNHMATINLVKIGCSLNEAKIRVTKRDDLLLSDTSYIDKQHNQYKSLSINTDSMYQKTTPYSYIVDKNCIICDLDGTLSLYEEGQSPYDREFERDIVNTPIRDFLESMAQWKNDDSMQYYKIFLFSGRSSKYVKQTRQFLNRAFGSDVDYKLVMREEGDNRRDSHVKMDMYNTHVKDKYNVFCVFDDRLQVIEEVWNRLGVFVFNCNQGNKRF